MTTYRPLPHHPGYTISRMGVVMAPERLGKASKLGKPRIIPAGPLMHVGRGKAYVVIGGTWYAWAALVREAWPDDDRPKPLYGLVMTLAELRLTRGK